MALTQHFAASQAGQFLAAVLVVLLQGCGGGVGGIAPTASLVVAPESIVAGQSATLTWTSSNAPTCQASGDNWGGTQPANASMPVSPSIPGTYTYTLKCSSGGSSAIASATLTVTPAPLAIAGGMYDGVLGTPFSQSIQVTGGVAPYAWKVMSGTLPPDLSLSQSAGNTVTVEGTPETAVQGAAFTIGVTDSEHKTASAAFTVSILLQASSLVLSASSLNFGNQVMGSPGGTLTETLTNTATTAMIIGNAAINPNPNGNTDDFTLAGSTCSSSLAPGESCAINVTFKPAQSGPRNATMSITDDASGSPQSVPLLGTGLSNGPNVTFWSSGLSLGTQLVGTKSPEVPVNLTNYGTTALNVGSISTSTASFAETDNCVGTVAAGATCTIFVTFTPGDSNPVTATLAVSDDAAGSPQTVSLSGTGSANTPTLTGSCAIACNWVRDTAECPAGARSEHPSQGSCPSGASGGFEKVPIDADRGCRPSGTKGFGHGWCATE
jgi:hypothetical protein